MVVERLVPSWGQVSKTARPRLRCHQGLFVVSARDHPSASPDYAISDSQGPSEI